MALSNEELIKKGVMRQLTKDESLDVNHIRVNISTKGIVTLEGTVRSYSEKISAREDAARVLGVKRIINNLKVVYPEDHPEPDEEKIKVYLMMKKLLKV